MTPAPGTRPVLLVLAAIVSVQVGAAFAKGLFPALGPAGAVTLRLVAAAVVVAIVVRPSPRGLSRAQVLPVLAFAAVLAGMNASFYAAIERIPLGVAVTLEFAGPLMVAVLGARRALDLLWVALAGAGVVLLTGGGAALRDGTLDPLGTALAALAGACWAGYILLSRRVGAVLPGMRGLALAMALAALLVAPAGIAQAGPALLTPHLVALGLAVGLLSSALPWALELVALRSLPTAAFGVLMSLEPAAAALVGHLLLAERLSPAQVAAIGLTCLAGAGAARPASPVHTRERRAATT